MTDALKRALILVLPALSASAAPPTLDTLYPAGAQRGTTVSVFAAGGFDRWPVQCWASAPGIKVEADKTKGKLNITVAADVPAGVHRIRLADEAGASVLRPFLVGTLPELMEAEPNDEPAKAQTLPKAGNADGHCGAVINGKLEKAGDADVYSVKLTKGRTLVASLLGDQVLKSPMDAVVQVLNSDGFVLEQNHDFRGLDPQTTFEIPADGTYLVRVFAYPAVPDSSIRLAGGESWVYRLTLTTGAFLDHAFPPAVGPGAPSIQVGVWGWNLPESARSVSVADGPPGWVEQFHPQAAGSVEVSREPHPVAVEAEPNDPAKPQAIGPLPVTMCGRIESSTDVDTFEFPAAKGKRLTLRVRSDEREFPLDPVLRITDADGKTLMELDDARGSRTTRDVELLFVPPADGKYRVSVRDLHGRGGPRFVYLLDILGAEPDFDLSVPGDRFTVVPGKPTELTVTLDRRNGFAGEIVLVAEGLPEGVTAAEVKTTGAAAKSAVLKLACDKGPVGGAFRVVARSAGKVRIAKTAPAPAAAVGAPAPTSDLWVTVLKPGATIEAPRPVPKKKR